MSDDERHADRYGVVDAPLVVLIHGAVVNRATMAPLATALATRFHVVVPDLPGHGTRRNERFAIEGALATLTAIVNDAHGERAIVAGDSLGGYLALALAARADARVRAVVAGGCSFPMNGAAGFVARASDVVVRAATRIAGAPAIERSLMRAFRAAGGDADVAASTQTGGLRLEARGESIDELRSFDLATTVASIACPVTFVNGARDVPIVWFAKRYARSARHGNAIRIPGAMHGVMTLQPLAVSRIIANQ